MISVLCIGWFLYPFSISTKLIKRVFYFYESTICTLLDAYDYDRLINNFLTKCLRNSNNDLVAVLLHKSTFLCIILFFICSLMPLQTPYIRVYLVIYPLFSAVIPEIIGKFVS